MREIKFRAWDKKAKKMRQVVNMVFNVGFGVETNDNSLKLIWVKGYDVIEQKEIQIQKEKDIELMQYTGLHDKNGKEIYEGDIVEWAGIRMEVFWGEDIGIGYGFCWRNIEGEGGYHESMTGFIDEYEVIGNIYDNPDLLEG